MWFIFLLFKGEFNTWPTAGLPSTSESLTCRQHALLLFLTLHPHHRCDVRSLPRFDFWFALDEHVPCSCHRPIMFPVILEVDAALHLAQRVKGSNWPKRTPSFPLGDPEFDDMEGEKIKDPRLGKANRRHDGSNGYILSLLWAGSSQLFLEAFEDLLEQLPEALEAAVG